MDTIIALILGLIEGITEYLPISSSGHLIMTEHLLHFEGDRADIFTVIIQPGAILAVVVVYWKRFWGLLFPHGQKGFAGWRGIWMLLLTTLPACVFGLLLHSLFKDQLFSPATVLAALITGGLCMILVEKLRPEPSTATLDELTPKMALGIGFFQCLALWPGFSRSAATIMGGMLLGAQRGVAVTYSFIAAVPVMFAASGYEILKNYAIFTTDNLLFFLTGLVCAFLSSLLVIKVFIALLSRITLIPFAIYRLLLAPVFYFMIVR